MAALGADRDRSKLIKAVTNAGGPFRPAVNLKGQNQTWTINKNELNLKVRAQMRSKIKEKRKVET